MIDFYGLRVDSPFFPKDFDPRLDVFIRVIGEDKED